MTSTGARGVLNKRRLAWLTNHWAPYRRPVWRHIGQSAELSVHLLQPNFRHVQRENRGRDWQVQGNQVENYKVRSPRTLAVNLHGAIYSFLFTPRRILDSADVVVLGGWESPAYWQVLFLARLKGCRSVGFYESTLLSNRYKSGVVARLRRYFFQRLDAVVVPGIAAKEAVLAFGVAPEKVFTGFNAVDVVSAAQTANEARAALSSNEDTAYRLVYVGQLITRKNVDSLLRALALLGDPYSLTIVGQGAEQQSLVGLANALGVAGRVKFVGYVVGEAVPVILSAHSVLVLPSYEEVWGLVVNEALACGLHVVVSVVCGVAPSVAGMRGVWLCDTSPAALAHAIRLSCAAWSGPINQPEILQHTPQAFAETFLEAAAGAAAVAP
jgi:glycosyltransferase involved in cell wall biosynthesis